jgi:hypothetical protein
MQMTGHETRSVFERYNIVSAGDLREAAKRLDVATGTISGTIGENGAAEFQANGYWTAFGHTLGHTQTDRRPPESRAS